MPIHYTSRLARLKIRDEKIEEKFQELMGSKSDDLKNEMIKKWTALRRIIENNEERLNLISQDIVEHFNDREIEGKAMVVAISRKAAVKYKRRIESMEDAPETAVVITNPSEFIENPKDEKTLKRRFKDPDDPLKIAVVCDKWTTGFDVPHLHTMYIDKPMKNHNLLQTIARVNRVYKDKPGGLIVDYIGIADNLKSALDKYTSDIQEKAMVDLDKAVEVMMEKYQKVDSFFEKTNYSKWTEKEGIELQRLVWRAENEILETEEKAREYENAVNELNKAFSIVSPHDEAVAIQTDVVFFRGIKNSIQTVLGSGEEPSQEVKSAMKKLVAKGVTAENIVEVSGLDKWKEEKAVLSDEFLEDVEEVEYENLQVRMLERLLRNEINHRKKENLAKYESFEEKLEETINKYNNSFITTQQVLEKLREYAEQIQQEDKRKDELGLSEEELAFYDAIESHGGTNIEEEKLKEIAIKLKKRLKKSANIDWTSRTKMRSEMKSESKKVLRSGGLTHDRYEPMIEPIVSQAEAFYGRETIATV